MALKRIRIGSRSDNRQFNFNGAWSPNEIDKAKQQLQEVCEACCGWNRLSNSIADSIHKKRINPVPIPDLYLYTDLPDQPGMEDGIIPLISMIAKETIIPFFNLSLWENQLRIFCPSVNWASLGNSGIDQSKLIQLRKTSMDFLQVAADSISSIDSKPASTALPVPGTLHQAMNKYDQYVKTDQPTNFDRHAKIKQLIERSENIPLAMCDITQCRLLIDYWRSRPMQHSEKKQYSAKRSREQLRELDLFFIHTHTSNDFNWRMPTDLQLLKRSISNDEKKNLSFITIKLFTVDELKKIISTGSLIQRLITTWCLNCSHGAAEIGRVTWGDLYLNQDHPWKSQGLAIESGGNWTGFLRHKSDVVGWWQLWPETVELIEQWKPVAEKLLKRKIKDTDRLILTQSGSSMYKDETKNAQSKFAKEFVDVRKLAGVPTLPFGTLRNQLSDWITTIQGDAVAASVALAHGIPHKADKLLFAHYANRPWKKLFEYQMKYREVIFAE